MKKGFVKNISLLEETSKVEDCFDSKVAIDALSERLSKFEESGILGLVGRFGIGKSTLLHNVYLSRKEEKSEKWVEFDAWKFPDRKDLWEGFTLELAKQVNPKVFEDARKALDGKKGSDKETLTNVLAAGGALFVNPALSVIKSFNHFFRSSPARRVFEIQEILINVVKECESSRIVIVVEDVDRSGDAGVFFLETLNQFLRTADLDKQVLAIVPIGDDIFKRNHDCYLKCLNYVEFFKSRQLSLANFVEDIFESDVFKNTVEKEQLVSFLEAIFREYPTATMRLLKLILRNANDNYILQSERGECPDVRLTILFESAKYFPMTDKEGSATHFDNWRGAKMISNSQSVFVAFLSCIFSSRDRVSTYRSLYHGSETKNLLSAKYPFEFTDKQIPGGFPIGIIDHWDEDEKFVINDFYLNY